MEDEENHQSKGHVPGTKAKADYSAEGKPFISVIITAHNRRQYVLGAFKSAINQTLERSKYEVIVSKNFYEEKIDRFIKENKGILVFFQEEGKGQRLADAIKHARGEILCFLDDDDLFTRNKLETIYDIFSKNRNIGFVSNDKIYIGEDGKPLEKKPGRYKEPKAGILNKKSLLSLLRIENQLPWHNASSLSIRKGVLKGHLGRLATASRADDLFVYFAALGSKYDIFISDKKLTKYRIHESRSFSLSSLESYEKAKQGILKGEIENTRYFYAKVKDKTVKKYLQIYLAERSINYMLYSCNCRAKVLGAYLSILPYYLIALPRKAVILGVQVLFYAISPGAFRRFVYNYVKSHWYSGVQ